MQPHSSWQAKAPASGQARAGPSEAAAGGQGCADSWAAATPSAGATPSATADGCAAAEPSAAGELTEASEAAARREAVANAARVFALRPDRTAFHGAAKQLLARVLARHGVASALTDGGGLGFTLEHDVAGDGDAARPGRLVSCSRRVRSCVAHAHPHQAATRMTPTAARPSLTLLPLCTSRTQCSCHGHHGQ
jgi:hypothetical protein